MKCLISSVLLWCFFAGTVSAQIYLPVRENGRWGLIDTAGNMLIEPQYDYIEDVATWPNFKIAYLNGKSLLIDYRNKRVSPVWQDEIIPLGDSALLTVSDGKKGVISLSGRLLLENRFKSVSYLRRRYFLAQDFSEKLQLFDVSGHDLLGRSFDSLSTDDKFILAFDTGTAFIFTASGLPVHSGKYNRARFIYPFIGLYPGEKERFVILDTTGRQISENYFSRWEMAGSRFILVAGEQDYLLYRKNMLSQPVDEVKRFTPILCDTVDYVELQHSGGVNMVHDDLGNSFGLPPQTLINYCSRSYFVTSKDEKNGLVDRSGRVILPTEYDDIIPLESGFIRASIGKKAGVFSSTGREVLPVEYEEILFAENMIKAYHGSRAIILLLDANNTVIERQLLNDITPLEVRQAPPKILPTRNITGRATGPATATVVADQGNWRFDPLKKLWGYRLRDTVVIKPTFTTIERFVNYNITRVTNENRKSGLVRDSSGKILHQCGFDRLFTNDMDATNGAILRGMNSRGMYVLRSSGGKLRRAFTYIDEFHSGMARYNSGGKFTNLKDLRPSNYALGMNNISLYNYVYADKGTHENKANLTITGGRWGFLTREGKLVADTAYDWVTRFYGNVSFVMRSGKWGFITTDSKGIDPRYDDIEFLEGSTYTKILTCSNIDRFCYIDNKGKTIAGPVYSVAHPFKNGIALVKRGPFFYYLNSEGQEINKEGYENAKEFDNGYAAVKVGKSWGVIDPSGKMVLEPVYSKIGRISDERVEVFKGMWGYVSLSEELEPHFIYQSVMPYSGDRSWVKQRGKWGMINGDGVFIVKPKFNKVKYSSEKGIYYVMKRRSWEMINQEGKKIFRKKFRNFTDFSEGIAILSKGKKHYLKNIENNKHYRVKARSIMPFSNGLAVIRVGNKFGAVDERGRVKIPVNYVKLDNFSEGLAACMPYSKHWRSTKYDYIDTTGKTVFDESFHFAGPFRNGWAMVRDFRGAFRFIQAGPDKLDEHSVINTETYTAVRNFSDSIGAIRGENGRIALVNGQGMLISSFRFAEIHAVSEGKAVMKIEKLYGLADNAGKVYFEPEFETIKRISDTIYRIESGNQLGYYNAEKGWIRKLTE